MLAGHTRHVCVRGPHVHDPCLLSGRFHFLFPSLPTGSAKTLTWNKVLAWADSYKRRSYVDQRTRRTHVPSSVSQVTSDMYTTNFREMNLVQHEAIKKRNGADTPLLCYDEESKVWFSFNKSLLPVRLAAYKINLVLSDTFFRWIWNSCC